MPPHGLQEDSGETELWEHRIKVIMNNYENYVKNELPYLTIPSKYSEFLKRMVEDLHFKIKSSLDNLTDPELSSDVTLILNEATSSGLSRVWNTTIDLTKNTLDVPKELYFFMDSIYERFGGEEVPYLITLTLIYSVPGTLDICKVMRQFLVNLFEARRYLSDKKLYLIFMPNMLIKNPTNWALLIHEAAHILEEEKLHIAEKYYPQLRQELYLERHNLVSSFEFNVEEAMPNWALEIACDILATISCGPIFGYRLYENFFREERSLYSTHPPIKKRLQLIADELERCEWKEEASDIRAKTKRIHMDSFIEKIPLPEHYDKIIDDVRTKARSEKIEYICTDELRTRISLLGERLNNLKPCITIKGEYVDLKDLLNASKHVKKERAETQEFKEFLADMIRLVTAKDLYYKYESLLTK